MAARLRLRGRIGASLIIQSRSSVVFSSAFGSVARSARGTLCRLVRRQQMPVAMHAFPLVAALPRCRRRREVAYISECTCYLGQESLRNDVPANCWDTARRLRQYSSAGWQWDAARRLAPRRPLCHNAQWSDVLESGGRDGTVPNLVEIAPTEVEPGVVFRPNPAPRFANFGRRRPKSNLGPCFNQ